MVDLTVHLGGLLGGPSAARDADAYPGGESNNILVQELMELLHAYPTTRVEEASAPTLEADTEWWVSWPPDPPDDTGQTAVVRAMTKRANRRPRNGIPPLFNKSERPALWLSVSEKNLRWVDFLLKAKVDVNAADIDLWTPLHVACRDGSLRIVTKLLESKANYELKNKEGATPLFIAACQSFHTVVDLLLKSAADVNSCDNDGWTPLHIACSIENNETVVKLLIEKGAAVDVANARGNTPMHVAARFSQSPLLHILVEVGGASLRSINEKGLSVLDVTARGSATRMVVEEMLYMGADEVVLTKSAVRGPKRKDPEPEEQQPGLLQRLFTSVVGESGRPSTLTVAAVVGKAYTKLSERWASSTLPGAESVPITESVQSVGKEGRRGNAKAKSVRTVIKHQAREVRDEVLPDVHDGPRITPQPGPVTVTIEDLRRVGVGSLLLVTTHRYRVVSERGPLGEFDVTKLLDRTLFDESYMPEILAQRSFYIARSLGFTLMPSGFKGGSSRELVTQMRVESRGAHLYFRYDDAYQLEVRHSKTFEDVILPEMPVHIAEAKFNPFDLPTNEALLLFASQPSDDNYDRFLASKVCHELGIPLAMTILKERRHNHPAAATKSKIKQTFTKTAKTKGSGYSAMGVRFVPLVKDHAPKGAMAYTRSYMALLASNVKRRNTTLPTVFVCSKRQTSPGTDMFSELLFGRVSNAYAETKMDVREVYGVLIVCLTSASSSAIQRTTATYATPVKLDSLIPCPSSLITRGFVANTGGVMGFSATFLDTTHKVLGPPIGTIAMTVKTIVDPGDADDSYIAVAHVKVPCGSVAAVLIVLDVAFDRTCDCSVVIRGSVVHVPKPARALCARHLRTMLTKAIECPEVAINYILVICGTDSDDEQVAALGRDIAEAAIAWADTVDELEGDAVDDYFDQDIDVGMFLTDKSNVSTLAVPSSVSEMLSSFRTGDGDLAPRAVLSALLATVTVPNRAFFVGCLAADVTNEGKVPNFLQLFAAMTPHTPAPVALLGVGGLAALEHWMQAQEYGCDITLLCRLFNTTLAAICEEMMFLSAPSVELAMVARIVWGAMETLLSADEDNNVDIALLAKQVSFGLLQIVSPLAAATAHVVNNLIIVVCNEWEGVSYGNTSTLDGFVAATLAAAGLTAQSHNSELALAMCAVAAMGLLALSTRSIIVSGDIARTVDEVHVTLDSQYAAVPDLVSFRERCEVFGGLYSVVFTGCTEDIIDRDGDLPRWLSASVASLVLEFYDTLSSHATSIIHEVGMGAYDDPVAAFDGILSRLYSENRDHEASNEMCVLLRPGVVAENAVWFAVPQVLLGASNLTIRMKRRILHFLVAMYSERLAPGWLRGVCATVDRVVGKFSGKYEAMLVPNDIIIDLHDDGDRPDPTEGELQERMAIEVAQIRLAHRTHILEAENEHARLTRDNAAVQQDINVVRAGLPMTQTIADLSRLRLNEAHDREALDSRLPALQVEAEIVRLQRLIDGPPLPPPPPPPNPARRGMYGGGAGRPGQTRDPPDIIPAVVGAYGRGNRRGGGGGVGAAPRPSTLVVTAATVSLMAFIVVCRDFAVYKAARRKLFNAYVQVACKNEHSGMFDKVAASRIQGVYQVAQVMSMLVFPPLPLAMEVMRDPVVYEVMRLVAEYGKNPLLARAPVVDGGIAEAPDMRPGMEGRMEMSEFADMLKASAASWNNMSSDEVKAFALLKTEKGIKKLRAFCLSTYNDAFLKLGTKKNLEESVTAAQGVAEKSRFRYRDENDFRIRVGFGREQEELQLEANLVNLESLYFDCWITSLTAANCSSASITVRRKITMALQTLPSMAFASQFMQVDLLGECLAFIRSHAKINPSTLSLSLFLRFDDRFVGKPLFASGKFSYNVRPRVFIGGRGFNAVDFGERVTTISFRPRHVQAKSNVPLYEWPLSAECKDRFEIPVIETFVGNSTAHVTNALVDRARCNHEQMVPDAIVDLHRRIFKDLLGHMLAVVAPITSYSSTFRGHSGMKKESYLQSLRRVEELRNDTLEGSLVNMLQSDGVTGRSDVVFPLPVSRVALNKKNELGKTGGAIRLLYVSETTHLIVRNGELVRMVDRMLITIQLKVCNMLFKALCEVCWECDFMTTCTTPVVTNGSDSYVKAEAVVSLIKLGYDGFSVVDPAVLVAMDGVKWESSIGSVCGVVVEGLTEATDAGLFAAATNDVREFLAAFKAGIHCFVEWREESIRMKSRMMNFSGWAPTAFLCVTSFFMCFEAAKNLAKLDGMDENVGLVSAGDDSLTALQNGRNLEIMQRALENVQEGVGRISVDHVYPTNALVDAGEVEFCRSGVNNGKLCKGLRAMILNNTVDLGQADPVTRNRINSARKVSCILWGRHHPLWSVVHRAYRVRGGVTLAAVKNTHNSAFDDKMWVKDEFSDIRDDTDISHVIESLVHDWTYPEVVTYCASEKLCPIEMWSDMELLSQDLTRIANMRWDLADEMHRLSSEECKARSVRVPVANFERKPWPSLVAWERKYTPPEYIPNAPLLLGLRRSYVIPFAQPHTMQDECGSNIDYTKPLCPQLSSDEKWNSYKTMHPKFEDPKHKSPDWLTKIRLPSTLPIATVLNRVYGWMVGNDTYIVVGNVRSTPHQLLKESVESMDADATARADNRAFVLEREQFLDTVPHFFKRAVASSVDGGRIDVDTAAYLLSLCDPSAEDRTTGTEGEDGVGPAGKCDSSATTAGQKAAKPPGPSGGGAGYEKGVGPGKKVEPKNTPPSEVADRKAASKKMLVGFDQLGSKALLKCLTTGKAKNLNATFQRKILCRHLHLHAREKGYDLKRPDDLKLPVLTLIALLYDPEEYNIVLTKMKCYKVKIPELPLMRLFIDHVGHGQHYEAPRVSDSYRDVLFNFHFLSSFFLDEVTFGEPSPLVDTLGLLGNSSYNHDGNDNLRASGVGERPVGQINPSVDTLGLLGNSSHNHTGNIQRFKNPSRTLLRPFFVISIIFFFLTPDSSAMTFALQTPSNPPLVPNSGIHVHLSTPNAPVEFYVTGTGSLPTGNVYLTAMPTYSNVFSLGAGGVQFRQVDLEHTPTGQTYRNCHVTNDDNSAQGFEGGACDVTLADGFYWITPQPAASSTRYGVLDNVFIDAAKGVRVPAENADLDKPLECAKEGVFFAVGVKEGTSYGNLVALFGRAVSSIAHVRYDLPSGTCVRLSERLDAALSVDQFVWARYLRYIDGLTIGERVADYAALDDPDGGRCTDSGCSMLYALTMLLTRGHATPGCVYTGGFYPECETLFLDDKRQAVASLLTPAPWAGYIYPPGKRVLLCSDDLRGNTPSRRLSEASGTAMLNEMFLTKPHPLSRVCSGPELALLHAAALPVPFIAYDDARGGCCTASAKMDGAQFEHTSKDPESARAGLIRQILVNTTVGVKQYPPVGVHTSCSAVANFAMERMKRRNQSVIQQAALTFTQNPSPSLFEGDDRSNTQPSGAVNLQMNTSTALRAVALMTGFSSFDASSGLDGAVGRNNAYPRLLAAHSGFSTSFWPYASPATRNGIMLAPNVPTTDKILNCCTIMSAGNLGAAVLTLQPTTYTTVEFNGFENTLPKMLVRNFPRESVGKPAMAFSAPMGFAMMPTLSRFLSSGSALLPITGATIDSTLPTWSIDTVSPTTLVIAAPGIGVAPTTVINISSAAGFLLVNAVYGGTLRFQMNNASGSFVTPAVVGAGSLVGTVFVHLILEGKNVSELGETPYHKSTSVAFPCYARNATLTVHPVEISAVLDIPTTGFISTIRVNMSVAIQVAGTNAINLAPSTSGGTFMFDQLTYEPCRQLLPAIRDLVPTTVVIMTNETVYTTPSNTRSSLTIPLQTGNTGATRMRKKYEVGFNDIFRHSGIQNISHYINLKDNEVVMPVDALPEPSIVRMRPMPGDPTMETGVVDTLMSLIPVLGPAVKGLFNAFAPPAAKEIANSDKMAEMMNQLMAMQRHNTAPAQMNTTVRDRTVRRAIKESESGREKESRKILQNALDRFQQRQKDKITRREQRKLEHPPAGRSAAAENIEALVLHKRAPNDKKNR